jgi:hypothetical protein
MTSIKLQWVKICLKAARNFIYFPKPKSIGPVYFYIYIFIIPCRRSCRKNIKINQEYQKARLVFLKHRADLELFDYEVAQELDFQIKKLDRRILKYGVRCGKCMQEKSSIQAT